MGEISFQYPTWYIVFAVLAGLIYALVLYFKDKSFADSSPVLRWVLGALRFLTVTTIGLLLMTPLLKSILTETKKPIIILAQDESASVKSSMDESGLQKYKEEITAVRDALKEDYDLRTYDFGSEVREGMELKFDDKSSNLSQMMTHIVDLYDGQNLSAVILATDGIYNEGSNPLYATSNLNAPVFVVALGDTIPKKDLILKRVFYNKIAYLGDKFTVQVDISAINCHSESTFLNVFEVDAGKTRKLQQIPLTIDKNEFFTTREVVLNAGVSGVRQFRFSLSPVKEEVTKANNAKDIFVDVLDARQKILLFANSPHPDIAALKRVLTTNKNYQVTVKYAADFQGSVADYDFIIFHQLPSKKYGITGALNDIKQRKISHLFVLGNQTDLNQFNTDQAVLNIQSTGSGFNDVTTILSTDFNLFTLSDDVKRQIPDFPPLSVPFGEFTEAPGSTVLLHQKIGKVATKYPLLIFKEDGDIKTGVLAGEGIWRWRLYDYLQNQNHNISNELIAKSLQYLTVKEDKRKFRVSLDKNIFKENERVFFQGELYNENFELINDPDVTIKVTDDSGKEFDFTFTKTADAYVLDAGILHTGNYTYKATVVRNGVEMTAAGKFSVQPVQLELYEQTANHGLLRLMSEKFGGKFFLPENTGNIAATVKADDRIKPTVYQTTRTRPLINLKWLFALLAGLLAVEWFLRRYFGGY